MAGEGVPELTRREREVLVALCRPAASGEVFTEPASVREIARELYVTEAAVKQHLLHLYEKFGIGGEGERRPGPPGERGDPPRRGEPGGAPPPGGRSGEASRCPSPSPLRPADPPPDRSLPACWPAWGVGGWAWSTSPRPAAGRGWRSR
ncbi:MAG: hypothetical protein KatS3mg014_0703 [Actinomycetota bacterium]|nr:MAG: hypothetical protein KatS3mg014_0703 [Actinomycetota bacterium]